MHKRKSSNAALKAWNNLHLALLWARKGRALMHKRRLMRHLPNFIKTLRHTEAKRHGALYYGDRQFSFSDTPIISVKMHRPHSMSFRLPCINPEVDFDYELGDESNDDVVYVKHDVARKSFLKNGDHYNCEDINGGEEGIDLKAEEFIAKFYEQLKLQRQISYIQYN